jgi:nucleoside-diphosphate-sugar epimerase
MRVTVTGGTGFLGGFLVRDLLAKGHSVRVLARTSQRAGALRLLGAEISSGDLADATSIAGAVSGAEVVYHLAAKVGAAPRQAYFDINVAGTEHVLAACEQARVSQVVYASSLSVYGPVIEGAIIDEATPFDDRPELRDPYAQSKIEADRLVSAFAGRTRIPTVIVREGIIFGPGRQLPIGMYGFTAGRTNYVFGNPQHRFPLNYVENIVEAIQAAAATGDGFRQYNVLDDDELTLGNYHEIKSKFDRTTTRFYPGWLLSLGSPITEALRHIIDMGDTRLSRHQLQRALQDRHYDTSRIRRDTGWAPRVPLQEAVLRTLAHSGGLQ